MAQSWLESGFIRAEGSAERGGRYCFLQVGTPFPNTTLFLYTRDSLPAKGMGEEVAPGAKAS